MTEAEIRSTVKSLKKFYTEIVWFILGNSLFLLIWLTYDRQCVFWPKYIFLVWGISLIVTAYRQGVLDHYLSKFFLLSQEWEEERVSEMIDNVSDQKKIPLHRYWKKK